MHRGTEHVPHEDQIEMEMQATQPRSLPNDTDVLGAFEGILRDDRYPKKSFSSDTDPCATGTPCRHPTICRIENSPIATLEYPNRACTRLRAVHGARYLSSGSLACDSRSDASKEEAMAPPVKGTLIIQTTSGDED